MATTIEAVCNMPAEFRRRGDISMMNLLRESGHLETPAELTEEALRQHIEAHPEIVPAWVTESQDQRSSECWYLLEPAHPDAAGSWVVGFYPGGPKKRYSNAAQACAAYIKHYVERLRRHAKNAS